MSLDVLTTIWLLDDQSNIKSEMLLICLQFDGLFSHMSVVKICDLKYCELLDFVAETASMVK